MSFSSGGSKAGGTSTGTSGTGGGQQNDIMSFLFGPNWNGSSSTASPSTHGMPTQSQPQISPVAPQHSYGPMPVAQSPITQPITQGITQGIGQGVGQAINSGIGSIFNAPQPQPVSQPMAPQPHPTSQPTQPSRAPVSSGSSPANQMLSMFAGGMFKGSGNSLFGGGQGTESTGPQFNTPPSNEQMGPTNEELGYNPTQPVAPTEDPWGSIGSPNQTGGWDPLQSFETPTWETPSWEMPSWEMPSFDPGSFDTGGYDFGGDW
jgi:hypothetical protein